MGRKNYSDIADAFVNGDAPHMVQRLFGAVGANNGGWGENTARYALPGTLRFWFDDHFLYSYDMPLAYRNGEVILVNGGGAPTQMTSQHQSALRVALLDAAKAKKIYAFIPFVTLEEIGVRKPEDYEEIFVVHITPDRTVDMGQRKCRRRCCGPCGKHYHVIKRHFLGETLFTYKKKYFVCGLDRNDNPTRRMFYLCELPKKLKPKTVDEALDSLRPDDVPSDAPRQGEWFFVPGKSKHPNGYVANKVPILSDRPTVMKKHVDYDATPKNVPPDRARRHVASKMLVMPDGVFVRGVIRDDDHDALNLGTDWHKVVKNLAVQGFRYEPKGHERGTRVD